MARIWTLVQISRPCRAGPWFRLLEGTQFQPELCEARLWLMKNSPGRCEITNHLVRDLVGCIRFLNAPQPAQVREAKADGAPASATRFTFLPNITSCPELRASWTANAPRWQ